MKRRKVKSIYSDEIYLCLDCDQQQFADYITSTYPKYKYENGKGADGHMEDPVDDDGVKIFYLWVDQTNTKATQRLVAVHECVHLVFALFDHVGIPTDKTTDEAFTYQLDDFVRQVFDKLNL